MIKSIYQDGYSWVEIPDEVWLRAKFSTYINGMNIS